LSLDTLAIVKITRKLLASLAAASICISGLSARALTITTADYGIGTVVDGTPADQDLLYVQLLVDIWNGTKPSGIYQFGNKENTFAALSGGQVPATLTAPTSGNQESQDFTGMDNKATIDLGAGAEFLLTKWGGGDILFYIGGLTGPVTVVNDQISPGNAFTGLSGFELLGPIIPGSSVADGGSTVALLGFALCGFALLGRKFRKN
jgi:hypothetical protein